jgi:hypothetical protein
LSLYSRKGEEREGIGREGGEGEGVREENEEIRIEMRRGSGSKVKRGEDIEGESVRKRK